MADIKYSDKRFILVDDSGWGDPILGVVIGILDLPAGKYFERRIPLIYFQPPRFEKQEYLNRVVDIVLEAIKVMKLDKKATFKICTGYVFSKIRNHLRLQGFTVKDTEIVGDLQKRIEKSYLDWCKEIGVPKHILGEESGKPRFWALINWVKEKPKLRELLVKTGWKSWEKRWRDYVYSET